MSNKVYHACGEQFYRRTYWGVSEYVVQWLLNPDSGEIHHCPQCGERLLPRDMGVTIFTEIEWQYEVKRRKREGIEAAAPDLLEACEVAYRAMTDDPKNSDAAWMRHDDAVEMVRAAIAKAKGETNE